MKTSFALTAALFLVACNPQDDSPDISITRVDQGTADSALAALSLANSGDGVVTYASRDFSDGIYTFSDVVFTDPEDEMRVEGDVEYTDDGDGPEEVHAARMVLAGPRFDAEGNVIFDRLSIEAGRFADENDDSEGGFDSFVIEGPNAAFVADIARGFAGEESNDSHADTYQFGLVALDGLSIEGDDAESGEDFTVALTRFALVGFDGSHMERFELIGLNIDGTSEDTGPIHIELAEMSMDGIGQSIFLPLRSSMQEALAEEAMETSDPIAYPDDFDPLDSYDSFAMRGLDINVGGVMVTLDAMTADVEETATGIVSTSTMTPLLIRADTEQTLGAQLALGLGMLGYQQLEFNGAGEAVYDRETDRVYTRGENYFEMTDGFRVETDMDMSGYLEYVRRAMDMTMGGDTDEVDPMAMVEPLMLSRFVLRIEDHSILDRALTAGSAAQGMSKGELRQQASAMISLGMLGAPAEIPRPLLSELSTALVGFINGGGTIVIAMEPDAPVSLATIATQAEAGELDYDALGLSITTEAPEQE